MVQLGRALTDQDLQPAIHALVVYNSNPAVIAPNQNLVLRDEEGTNYYLAKVRV